MEERKLTVSKLKGLRPRINAWKGNCNHCWQKLSEDRETTWFQGRPYHKDCFDREMAKPLHLRFAKSLKSNK